MNIARRLMPVLLCAVSCILVCLARPLPAADNGNLTISNQTSKDLLNIRFGSGRNIHFVRLDMQPGGRDEIENPGGTVDLRLDLGLALWFFKAVPLGQARRLTFCGDHSACLILDLRSQQHNKASRHMNGTTQGLLPKADGKPVCTLDQFRPGMTMQDACGLLSPNSPRDDNDAVLTSLGFADMVWAARLSPGQPAGNGGANSPGPDRLDHLELRQRLEPEYLEKLLTSLYAQGYSPWQAELPGLDMNFTEMGDLNPARQKDILQQALKYFLASGRGEATIMLAPAAMLPSLANADAPRSDVQLFTLTLRQGSKTLIVDVAAYQGGEGGR